MGQCILETANRARAKEGKKPFASTEEMVAERKAMMPKLYSR